MTTNDKDFPTYNLNEKCPKCGSGDILCEYHPYDPTRAFPKERISLTCRKCGFHANRRPLSPSPAHNPPAHKPCIVCGSKPDMKQCVLSEGTFYYLACKCVNLGFAPYYSGYATPDLAWTAWNEYNKIIEPQFWKQRTPDSPIFAPKPRPEYKHLRCVNCGGEPEQRTTEAWEAHGPGWEDMNEKPFSVVCSACGRKTGYYSTINGAWEAWDAKMNEEMSEIIPPRYLNITDGTKTLQIPFPSSNGTFKRTLTLHANGTWAII